MHFLLRAGGPAAGERRLLLISVGATLAGWVADLRSHPRAAGMEVVAVEWKPGKAKLRGGCGMDGVVSGARDEARQPHERGSHSAAISCAGTQSSPPIPQRPFEGGGTLPRHARRATADGHGTHTLRLWAFGNARVRERVRELVGDWIEGWDLFVA